MVDGEWCMVDSAGLVARSLWLIAPPPVPSPSTGSGQAELRVTFEDDGEERFWGMGKKF